MNRESTTRRPLRPKRLRMRRIEDDPPAETTVTVIGAGDVKWRRQPTGLSRCSKCQASWPAHLGHCGQCCRTFLNRFLDSHRSETGECLYGTQLQVSMEQQAERVHTWKRDRK